MSAVIGHPLFGKRVKLNGHIWKVKYVMRNPDGEHPWSGREWVHLTGDRGASTTAWAEDVEVISAAKAHPVNRASL